MFDEIDAAYYRARAAEVRDKADLTPIETTATKHKRLAEAYEQKAQRLIEDMTDA